MFNKIIKLVIFLGFTKSLLAQEILTFDDAKIAVKKGYDINIVVNLKKCSSDKIGKDFGRIINFKPDNFTLNNDNNLITSSYRNFTVFHPEHSGTQIYEYFNSYILADNTLVISVLHYSAKTKEQVCPSVKFACHLGSAARLVVNNLS